MYWGLANFHSVKQKAPSVASKSKAENYNDQISEVSLTSKYYI